MTAPGSPESTHLDPDLLADLAEGLLDDVAADTARLHIAACAACSGDYALINGLADISWDAIEPEPIPAEVVARVEAALHREPPLKPAAHPASERDVRKAPRRGFQLAFKILAGASAVAVVGYFGVSALSSSQSKEKASAASGVAAAPPDKVAPNAAAGGAMNPNASNDLGAVQRRAAELLSPGPAVGTADSTPGKTTAASVRPSAGASDATPDPSSVDALACWQGLRPNARLLKSAPYAYQGSDTEMLVFTVPTDSTKAEVVIAPATCPASAIAATTIAIP